MRASHDSRMVFWGIPPDAQNGGQLGPRCTCEMSLTESAFHPNTHPTSLFCFPNAPFPTAWPRVGMARAFSVPSNCPTRTGRKTGEGIRSSFTGDFRGSDMHVLVLRARARARTSTNFCRRSGDGMGSVMSACVRVRPHTVPGFCIWEKLRICTSSPSSWVVPPAPDFFF